MTETSDFPVGPLDIYRKNASFNWQDMKKFITEPDMVQYEVEFSLYKNECISNLFRRSMFFEKSKKKRNITKYKLKNYIDYMYMHLFNLKLDTICLFNNYLYTYLCLWAYRINLIYTFKIR